MTKKIAPDRVPILSGARYPPPYDLPCRERMRRRLGDAAGLTQFGVNLTRLAPGAWSSQRHWHTHEDEFIYIVAGEGVLVTNEGEELLRAGDCAGFKAGDPDGHQLQNRSAGELLYLEIGSRGIGADEVFYPDIDLHLPREYSGSGYTHRDGEPY